VRFSPTTYPRVQITYFNEFSNEKQPLRSPILRWFMFAIILANIAGSMSPMLMSIHLTQLGASVEKVSLVLTLSSVAILLLQIFGGWISDSKQKPAGTIYPAGFNSLAKGA
jgi:hypothetical protein